MSTLCENENKTRDLLDAYRDKDWTQGKAIIAIVFKAMWHASITAEHANRIGEALCSLESCDLQEELTKAVKAKVLRSYSKRGKRLYEVNY